jgi:uncharacterized protein (TIGR00369 family)
MAEEKPQDFADAINAIDADGWVKAMGLRITRATMDEVSAELTIGHEHRQAYGIVHGGVHAGVIESLCSIGAALNVMPLGKSAVGLENATSFLRAVRAGKLRATARPIARGRRSHVWEGSVQDEEGRLVATGRVRLMVLDPGDALGGERLDVAGGIKG